jgi:undecaprenyl-diphosphatase
MLGFVTALLALYGFHEIVEEVFLEQEAEHVDLAVLAWLHQFSTPGLDVAARVASALGSEGVGVFLVVLLAVFARQRRWGAAVALLLVTVGALVLNSFLKELFQRTRPAPLLGVIPSQAFSFPSGHAMVSAAFYLFLAYLGWRALRGWPRAVWVAAMHLLVFAIALSRLYLGVHYLTDVVAGYLAGFLWADTIVIAGHLLTRRRSAIRQGSAA